MNCIGIMPHGYDWITMSDITMNIIYVSKRKIIMYIKFLNWWNYYSYEQFSNLFASYIHY